jgi:hypothetical protein
MSNFKECSVKCLQHNGTDPCEETLSLYLRIQSGEPANVIQDYIASDGTTYYYMVEGHYAQAIYLKSSLDKATWVTIFSDSDH